MNVPRDLPPADPALGSRAGAAVADGAQSRMTRPGANGPPHRRYIRLLDAWRLSRPDPSSDVVWFDRVAFDRHRRRLPDRVREAVRFADTDLPAAVRLSVLGCVLLGKLSPPHADAVIEEYRASRRAGPVDGPPRTFGALLDALGPRAGRAFGDPMKGVLTAVLHRGLFGDRADLVQALDRMCALGAPAETALMAYFGLYGACRQAILFMALGLARELPSLSAEQVRAHADPDFFAWWRSRCTRVAPLTLPDGGAASLSLPSAVSARSARAVARRLEGLARDFSRLAALLGGPASAAATFVRAFGIELNDGAVNLLLNGRGGRACPRARDIEATVTGSAGHPTRAAFLKAVRIDGAPLVDVFGRFFAVG